MALLAFEQKGETIKKTAININDHKPDLGNIIILVATGEDLEHIRGLYDNVPIVKKGHTMCTWTGEMAQFIFDNL